MVREFDPARHTRAGRIKLLRIQRQSENRTRAEVGVIPIVVVDTAVRTVEVPSVVGVVISARTSLLAYIRNQSYLTCFHNDCKLGILITGRHTLYSEVKRL